VDTGGEPADGLQQGEEILMISEDHILAVRLAAGGEGEVGLSPGVHWSFASEVRIIIRTSSSLVGSQIIRLSLKLLLFEISFSDTYTTRVYSHLHKPSRLP
jgi:hypothetical protein